MTLQDSMRHEDKARSGLALGGIGAGWFELRKDGLFYNWNIFNNEPLGTGPAFDLAEDSILFFLLRYEVEGEEPKMKLLQIESGYEVASIPNHYYTFPWLRGVRETEYEASFPFTKLAFKAPDMPLVVEMEAWSPFIPHNAKDSSLPTALFDFRVRSTTSKTVHVMLLGSWRNGVGFDVDERLYRTDVRSGKGWKAFLMGCDEMDTSHDTFGTQALASLSGDSTYYFGWEHRHPYYEILIRHRELPNINDTDGRNMTGKDGRTRAGRRCWSTIATQRTLKGRQSFDHRFIAAWHFPNLYSGRTHKARQRGDARQRRLEGRYYDNFFDDAGDVLRYVIHHQKKLETETRRFHEAFYDSTAPDYVLDQVNSQLNTFLTSSWFTKAGDFGIQEGMTPDRNWGPLATIDVSLYGSFSTAALFSQLDAAMMQAHRRIQGPDGSVSHGIGRDFTQQDVHEAVGHRLDLPSQYVILALRHYFWTGDRDYLEQMWPSCKAALEYVLRERDMNGDLLPDMEGAMCTYDNFPMYGAAGFVASLWLGALAYAVEAARTIGDAAAADRYADILHQAAPVFEEKLWNGEYYRLYNDAGGPRGDHDEGCLTDQIIGQWTTHFIDAEHILNRRRVRKALRHVMKRNFHHEYGVLNCRWPEDEFLHPVDKDCWSDQANTRWTGVELAFSSFLIYEGLLNAGLKVIRHVDETYRSFGMYFDHQEFGGHYFRPMSAWANLNALLGLAVREDAYTFDPRINQDEPRLLFAYGEGYGHYERQLSGSKEKHTIEVHTGTWRCGELTLGLAQVDRGRFTLRAGGRAIPARDVDRAVEGGRLRLRFRRRLAVKAGQALTVTAE